jgi:phosphoribosylamine---glycine ligase
VRFGDPEIQAILPRLRSDIVEAMLAVLEGRLEETDLMWTHEACVTVVVASGGYPGDYSRGYPISGIAEAESVDGVIVFQAGTRLDAEGRVLTNGGRVLAVSGLGENFGLAREKAYRGAEKISFQDMYYRKDIAMRAVEAAK